MKNDIRNQESIVRKLLRRLDAYTPTVLNRVRSQRRPIRIRFHSRARDELSHGRPPYGAARRYQC